MFDEGNGQLSAVGFFNPSLGGGGSAVGAFGGGSSSEFAFDIEGENVVRCGLLFGRRWVECGDTKLDCLAPDREPQGSIYATVTHSTYGEPELKVEYGPELPENGLDVSHRLLYRAIGQAGSRSWADFRSAVTITAMD